MEGRGLTEDELARVLERYPGNIPTSLDDEARNLAMSFRSRPMASRSAMSGT